LTLRDALIKRDNEDGATVIVRPTVVKLWVRSPLLWPRKRIIMTIQILLGFGLFLVTFLKQLY